MNYRFMGRTGLKVSELCLGTQTFGWGADEPTAHTLADRFVEAGGNFFDTSNIYNEGQSEMMLGSWLKSRGQRAQLVVASKVFFPVGGGPNETGLTRKHIYEQIDASLRRLQTDHIDLYQMHHIDRDTPWEEIWQAMEQLVSEGKIIYVGSSNFAGWNIAEAELTARARNFIGLVSEQSLYNLCDRMIELEVLPACRAFGLGLIPWSPLRGGLLAGSLKKAKTGRRRGDWVKEGIEKHRTQLEKYESLCDEIGDEPSNVALAWLLHNPTVTAPIIGPRTLKQLEGSMRAIEVKLTEDVLKKLNEIWLSPGGEAPEAYAW